MSDLLHILQQPQSSTYWEQHEVYDLIHSHIKNLLEHDTPKLFQVLYRIDVKETLVKEAFEHAAETTELAQRLTDIIIIRLKEKADWRNKYR